MIPWFPHEHRNSVFCIILRCRMWNFRFYRCLWNGKNKPRLVSLAYLLLSRKVDISKASQLEKKVNKKGISSYELRIYISITSEWKTFKAAYGEGYKALCPDVFHTPTVILIAFYNLMYLLPFFFASTLHKSFHSIRMP